MTIRLLLLLMAVLSTEAAFGQSVPKTGTRQNLRVSTPTAPVCGFDPLLTRQMQQADFRSRQEVVERQLYQQAEQLIRRRNSSQARSNTDQDILTVPLVIHIIHLSSEPNPGDGPSNPPDPQILAGLNHLNDAFRNIGTFAPSGHNDHPAVQSVDVGIEFCLAKQDIYGQPTSGIFRYSSDIYSDLNADLEDPQMQEWVAQQNGGALATTDYVHVWLVNKICRGAGTSTDPLNCNIGGYGYYPATHDFVNNGVINVSYLWGTSEIGSKVYIHEFGHFLGLYHTFQGGCPNGDCLAYGDRVCDTPPDTGLVSAAVERRTTAALPMRMTRVPITNPFQTDQDDLYENYMDYTSNYCRNTFTQGQADRMRAALSEIRGSLLQSVGCEPGIAAGTCTETELMLMDEEINSGIYDDSEAISASGVLSERGTIVFYASQKAGCPIYCTLTLPTQSGILLLPFVTTP